MTSEKIILPLLVEISKVDSSLARIEAEKKKLETEFSSRLDSIKKKGTEQGQITKQLTERKTVYSREEKTIKEERDKIVQRRRALATMNNYKVQQAAERELDHAGRQLSAREETLIAILQEIENLEKALNSSQSESEQLASEKEAFESDARATLQNLDSRSKELKKQREDLASRINPSILQQYGKVRDRFPLDPLVSVTAGKNCAGCSMQLGPQVQVQLHKGEALIKCPGCARILFLSEASKEE